LLGWAFALIGAGELNVILKSIFRRLRPQLPDPWVTPAGWSFPSGHAMGSFVTYGFLACLLIRVPRADFPRRTAVAVLAKAKTGKRSSWVAVRCASLTRRSMSTCDARKGKGGCATGHDLARKT
jgi:membrane-associated phospholipid phosphatase